LAAFLAEKRTKEIGIRKVLGASIPKIVFMLTKEFVIWVLLANIIAWPLSYILLNKWLEDFAYRIEIDATPFILSAVIALVISIFTVSYQTVKAAGTNPVESLKYE
jgi:putative ABC transport system permease protein